ncbi:hypothetical protein VIGAN_UM156100 [Vigna angularis var. angularis]|uniref:Alpha-D-phosphohexomutase alpha/beta/alpha domain-containing protein n=1 Tax=Vigna angularis var. angularis TaxID=157739 RepID=A0A0S3TF13_PHAAN|nr:hypothetical protein VIGAN_UM156100 [Vigna angularis var. angularis]
MLAVRMEMTPLGSLGSAILGETSSFARSMIKILGDIRGVAIDGVEGEKVNLTQPVAEAIGAAFAAWLMEKKKADSSQHLRVSIGHDTRISAKLLQNAISRGLAGAGLEFVHYGQSV